MAISHPAFSPAYDEGKPSFSVPYQVILQMENYNKTCCLHDKKCSQITQSGLGMRQLYKSTNRVDTENTEDGTNCK